MKTDSSHSFFDADRRKAEQSWDLLKRNLIFRFQHHLSWEAEDLAQEVIVRVLQKVPELKKISEKELTADDVIQFSFGVARNVALEAPRRRQWGGRTEGLPPDLEYNERFSSRGSDSLKLILEKERWDLVRACIETLALPDRKLFLSWYLEEKTAHKDLARELGTNDNGMRIRIHRMLKRVRECVRKRAGK